MPIYTMRALSLVTVVLLCTVSSVHSQTWPAPFDMTEGDYVFTEWPANSPAGTYPPHMRFHRGPSQDPELTAEPDADYMDAYNLTSGSRMNGLGAQGFAFQNIGTNGNLGAAVLALTTTGLENVQVTWTGGTVAAQPRLYRIRLQYRVGDEGSFVDAPGPIEYVASTTGHSEVLMTTLPAEVYDQPLVYLRWKYYQEPGGPTGARPALRVDNITVTTSDAPGSGTGTAAFDPDLVPGGETRTLSLVVTARSDEEDERLTHIDLALPEWAENVTADQVVLSPSGGAVEVDNGTIRISGADVSESQPLRIDLLNIDVPDVSGAFEFAVRTGAGSEQTVGIASNPVLRVWGTPIPIAVAAENDQQGVSTRLGEWVTIQGVVTVSDQFRTGGGEAGPSYLQDDSGGFAVFSPSNVSEQVEIGDEVILFGRVDQFFGLNQLDNTTIVIETVSTGNEVEPEVVTLGDVAHDGQGGVEVYEGRLVRINNVMVNTTVWNAEGAGTNYLLSDGPMTLDVRINGAVDFRGDPAPAGAFDIVGVVSQFRPSPPNIGGYQLMPRFADDIIDVSEAPAITSTPPFERAATPTSVTIEWTTDRPSHSEVRYVDAVSGETSAVIDEDHKTSHTVVVSDLNPATIYTLELRTAAGPDTTRIRNYHVTTTAPEGTTHAINVYFNKSVDRSLATFQEATVRMPHFALLDRINEASHSVDIALYSLSGTVGASIADALITARTRGVQVRVIMDQSTSNTAPPTNLRNNNIPFITDDFGANVGSEGLHHNKFAVFDFFGGEPHEVWVITGSWNPTDPGTQVHNQNILEIQDASLAGAYTAEFEQMWGSSTTTPSAGNSRFGANKTVVTPTVFWIGDVQTRLIFSPQGFGVFGTTEHHIISALNTAEHAIDLGLNLITRQTIVDAMRQRYDQGVKVRGVIGDIGTTGSVYGPLSQWADVHELPQGTFGLLHHKYAIVDAERPEYSPITITGSHNWSRSANESNDENTLIIYDANIANQYLQEFAARYRDAGGEDLFEVSIEYVDADVPQQFTLSANYPNPFNPSTTFEYRLPYHSNVTVTVFNALGQEVARVVDAFQTPGTYSVTYDASQLSSGVYLYQVEAIAESGRMYRETRRMVLIK